MDDALNGSPPPPMRLGMRIAMCLELALVTVMLLSLPHWSSVIGLLICAGYAWFSATWAAFSAARDGAPPLP